MKTITEFAAITLKNAAKVQAELQAAGKTAEEMPAALGEALKLEGDKLIRIMSALEVVGTKLNDLKRVVVLSIAEGEKAPAGAQQKGELYFAAEYYPPIAGKGAPGKHEHGKGPRGKDSKRGDRKGRRGRGGPRGERTAGAPGEGREGAPRGPRPPRGPKPPRNTGSNETAKQ